MIIGLSEGCSKSFIELQEGNLIDFNDIDGYTLKSEAEIKQDWKLDTLLKDYPFFRVAGLIIPRGAELPSTVVIPAGKKLL